MIHSKELNNLINALCDLNGVGYKLALKIAYQITVESNTTGEKIINSIQECRKNLSICKDCGNISNLTNLCDICSSDRRDRTLIMIVEDPITLISFENMGDFNGLYHVLNGVISPMEGKTPSDINISGLLYRLKHMQDVNEIIFGLSPSLEGESTISYIKDLIFKNFANIKLTKLARGLPSGTDIEYLSSRTLLDSLNSRIEVE